jgi:hypothetical protein
MKTKKKTTRAKKLAKLKQAQVRSKTARAHIAEEKETQDPTRKDGGWATRPSPLNVQEHRTNQTERGWGFSGDKRTP